jgi:hypothetical protein
MEFEPYTPHHFNTAPDIHDAYKTYESQNLEYFVCTMSWQTLRFSGASIR